MTEFLSMGGYGAFIWSAYGLALVILSFNLIRAVRCERRLKKDMARYFSSMAEGG
uniref:Heme exporter protein D n=1 Tax=Candidatus Kentrum sp. DK TaxID=2126562 RepID=A0A450RVG2_9GAMM|nr:MAG: heme exporter protein CcmD [Candidatus Kentron sp. DK]VFJ56130.1 MAG: heme exporter protein CcmD [Candidatus Kentron sp. DK]